MPRRRAPIASGPSSMRSGADGGRRLVGVCVARGERASLAWRIGGCGIILLWCMLSTGCCRVLGLAYRTTISEPGEYCPTSDRQVSLELYSKWADQAWRGESEACAESIMQPDYAVGFHDGFVDFVYSGGSGEPPPVPPRRFWNASFRTDEGKLRANQWFEGYRHGARVAREGGYRERATLHSSVADSQSDRHILADQREPTGS